MSVGRRGLERAHARRPTQRSTVLRFGPFVLVPERQLFRHGDAPVRIDGRALDVLAALVERPWRSREQERTLVARLAREAGIVSLSDGRGSVRLASTVVVQQWLFAILSR